MKIACPICGDPNAYPIWIDKDPPEGCPGDESWLDGGPVTIKTVSECSIQRKRAERQAAMRKAAPHCFDKFGNMRPGKTGEAFKAFHKLYPKWEI